MSNLQNFVIASSVLSVVAQLTGVAVNVYWELSAAPTDPPKVAVSGSSTEISAYSTSSPAYNFRFGYVWTWTSASRGIVVESATLRASALTLAYNLGFLSTDKTYLGGSELNFTDAKLEVYARSSHRAINIDASGGLNGPGRIVISGGNWFAFAEMQHANNLRLCFNTGASLANLDEILISNDAILNTTAKTGSSTNLQLAAVTYPSPNPPKITIMDSTLLAQALASNSFNILFDNDYVWTSATKGLQVNRSSLTATGTSAVANVQFPGVVSLGGANIVFGDSTLTSTATASAAFNFYVQTAIQNSGSFTVSGGSWTAIVQNTITAENLHFAIVGIDAFNVVDDAQFVARAATSYAKNVNIISGSGTPPRYLFAAKMNATGTTEVFNIYFASNIVWASADRGLHLRSGAILSVVGAGTPTNIHFATFITLGGASITATDAILEAVSTNPVSGLPAINMNFVGTAVNGPGAITVSGGNWLASAASNQAINIQFSPFTALNNLDAFSVIGDAEFKATTMAASATIYNILFRLLGDPTNPPKIHIAASFNSTTQGATSSAYNLYFGRNWVFTSSSKGLEVTSGTFTARGSQLANAFVFTDNWELGGSSITIAPTSVDSSTYSTTATTYNVWFSTMTLKGPGGFNISGGVWTCDSLFGDAYNVNPFVITLDSLDYWSIGGGASLTATASSSYNAANCRFSNAVDPIGTPPKFTFSGSFTASGKGCQNIYIDRPFTFVDGTRGMVVTDSSFSCESLFAFGSNYNLWIGGLWTMAGSPISIVSSTFVVTNPISGAPYNFVMLTGCVGPGKLSFSGGSYNSTGGTGNGNFYLRQLDNIDSVEITGVTATSVGSGTDSTNLFVTLSQPTNPPLVNITASSFQVTTLGQAMNFKNFGAWTFSSANRGFFLSGNTFQATGYTNVRNFELPGATLAGSSVSFISCSFTVTATAAAGTPTNVRIGGPTGPGSIIISGGSWLALNLVSGPARNYEAMTPALPANSMANLDEFQVIGDANFTAECVSGDPQNIRFSTAITNPPKFTVNESTLTAKGSQCTNILFLTDVTWTSSTKGLLVSDSTLTSFGTGNACSNVQFWNTVTFANSPITFASSILSATQCQFTYNLYVNDGVTAMTGPGSITGTGGTWTSQGTSAGTVFSSSGTISSVTYSFDSIQMDITGTLYAIPFFTRSTTSSTFRFSNLNVSMNAGANWASFLYYGTEGGDCSGCNVSIEDSTLTATQATTFYLIEQNSPLPVAFTSAWVGVTRVTAIDSVAPVKYYPLYIRLDAASKLVVDSSDFVGFTVLRGTPMPWAAPSTPCYLKNIEFGGVLQSSTNMGTAFAWQCNLGASTIIKESTRTATLPAGATSAPTLAPTPAPTLAPTPAPTLAPTLAPTPAPTLAPTLAPTPAPLLQDRHLVVV